MTRAAATNTQTETKSALHSAVLPVLPTKLTARGGNARPALVAKKGAGKLSPKHRLGQAHDFAEDNLYDFLEDPLLEEKEVLDAALVLISEQQKRISWLESLAVTDELTGLYNRRGFMTAAARSLAACARDSGSHGLLLLLDLDGFKQINDLHGHPAGDAYLKAVARYLRGAVRPMDILARLGGDEFAVLLSGASLPDGDLSAQRLVEGLNHSALEWNGSLLPLKASMGVVALAADETVESLFAKADARLYACKQARKK